MLAQMMTIYINGNSARGSTKSKPDDFLFKSVWKTEVEQDVDTIKNIFGIKK
jgi:hypothetical protein